MKRKIKLLPLAVAGALFTAGAAHAEGFSFNGGYFRAGAAAGAKKGHDRTCYQAPGSDWKYRLGNECDYYGEFMFSYGVGKTDDTQYNIYWMPNYYNGGVSDGSSLGNGQVSTVHVEQAYGEIKSPDFAKNLTFWAGSRFYGRQNGDQVDTFFVNMSGTGGGVDIGLGGDMKLGLAYFRADPTAPVTFDAASSDGQPGTRVNVDLSGIPAGPNNSLRFTGTYVKGDFTGGKSGFAFSVQDGLAILGGHNFAWLQYGEGSAGANQNFNSLTNGSDVKQYRFADSMDWQITPTFGGAAFLGYAVKKCSASCPDTIVAGTSSTINTGTQKHFSFGVRPALGFGQNFKLQGELAYDMVKMDSSVVFAGASVGSANMTKFTIAPTVSFGSTYWSRPDLRFYVTTAHWNNATNAAAMVEAPSSTGYGDLGGSTNGTSYGFQIEAWW